jgi:hypothetical protein
LQRERREISLAAISEQTKIKQSLLEALERDDLSHWPLGIFGRSYIRNYAQAIGLDPAATVREFIERHPASVDASSTLSEVDTVAPGKAGRRPPTRLEVLIDSAIGAIHARRAEQQRAADQQRAAAPQQTTAPAPAIAYSEAVARPRPQAQAPPAPAPEPASPEPKAVHLDLLTVAQLCTRLGCAQDASDVTGVLEEAARAVDAVGLILWAPDAAGLVLMPVFAYGYPDDVIVHMSRISTDANNASAEAFRTLTTCIVNGSQYRTGAIVAPLLTPLGGAGVLAVELQNGAEQREDVRAAITILAAQVSTLMGFSVLAAHTLSA